MFQDGATQLSINGDPLTMRVYLNGTQTVTRGDTRARNAKADVLPYNGTLHIIDLVLLPQALEEASYWNA